MSILNKIVSYYRGVTHTTEGVETNLLTLLKNDKHKDMILRLHQSDNETKKELKKSLPCFTVSGVFENRRDKGLLKYSGLAAVDLDKAEDFDALHLLNELKKIDCIAYGGFSCSGKRLYCIVPFKYGPELYVRQYEQLVRSFLNMGLPMGDDCHKKISQPRFVSWNNSNTEFFNHNAKSYDLLTRERTYHTIKRRKIKRHSIGQNPFGSATQILKKQGCYFQDGNKHEYIYNLCRLLNKKGVTRTEAERYIESNLIPLSQVRSNCITHPYKIHSGEFGSWNIQLTNPDYKEQKHVKVELSAKHKQTETWTNEIKELKQFFETTELPATIRLSQCATIEDIPLFIESHFATVKGNNGNRSFLPYLSRLQELKQVLTIDKLI